MRARSEYDEMWVWSSLRRRDSQVSAGVSLLKRIVDNNITSFHEQEERSCLLFDVAVLETISSSLSRHRVSGEKLGLLPYQPPSCAHEQRSHLPS